MIFEIIGWIGTILLIIAYLLVTAKKLPPTSVSYQLMNLIGALGVGINVFMHKAYPSFALEMVWFAIAIYGLYGIYKK